MEKEKVTRNDLRQMRIGQTIIFSLSDAKKVASARITAIQLRNEEDLLFDVRPDYQAKSICITRKK